MRPAAHFRLKLDKAIWIAGLTLVIALTAAARGNQTYETRHDQGFSSMQAVPESSVEANDPRQVTQYVMDFDGDHSLDLATVVEQATGGYTHYTVQLHLASGAERSLVVTAPPGGLQIEMKDLTGDRIPNDLVLRPALLRWLPTVLLNDGHGHYVVAISGTNPDSLSSDQQLAPKDSDERGTFALLSSGFKTGRLVNDDGLIPIQGQGDIVSIAVQTNTKCLGGSSNSGRAPPILAIAS